MFNRGTQWGQLQFLEAIIGNSHRTRSTTSPTLLLAKRVPSVSSHHSPLHPPCPQRCPIVWQGQAVACSRPFTSYTCHNTQAVGSTPSDNPADEEGLEDREFFTRSRARKTLALPNDWFRDNVYALSNPGGFLTDVVEKTRIGSLRMATSAGKDGATCEATLTLNAGQKLRGFGRDERKLAAEHAASFVILSKLHALDPANLTYEKEYLVKQAMMEPSLRKASEVKVPATRTAAEWEAIRKVRGQWLQALWDEVFGCVFEVEAIPLLSFIQHEAEGTAAEERKFTVNIELVHKGIRVSEAFTGSGISELDKAIETAAIRFGNEVRRTLEGLQNTNGMNGNGLRRSYEALWEIVGSQAANEYSFENTVRYIQSATLCEAQLFRSGVGIGEQVIWFEAKKARELALMSAALALQGKALAPVQNHVETVPDVAIPKPLSGIEKDKGPEVAPTPAPVETNIPFECFNLVLDTLTNARNSGLPDSTTPLLADKEVAEPYRVRPSFEGPASISIRLRREHELLTSQSPLRERHAKRAELPIWKNNTWARVARLVQDNDISIIVASTGSGKTTQVPQILLENAIRKNVGGYCDIICTQPRRIAATSVARRVAFERNEPLRKSVGYHIRHESRLPRRGGSITYCTTGILLKRLQPNPDKIMDTVSHLIVDEVHERDIPIDFLLTMLRQIIKQRRSKGQSIPKIILMSATINAKIFANYFRQSELQGDPLKIESIELGGRSQQITSQYLGDIIPELQATYDSKELSTLLGSLDKDTKPFLEAEAGFAEFQTDESRSLWVPEEIAESRTDNSHEPKAPPKLSADLIEILMPISLICAVVAHIAKTTPMGDVLVFLPGMLEINQIASFLEDERPLGVDFSDRHNFKVYKLHSLLRETNDEVFEPLRDGQRKIILATNIAETSITLPAVQYVVDCGKVREMNYDSSAKLSRFQLRWISRANSVQRRGRAGRLQAGHYFALFSKERYDALASYGVPEMVRSDLAEVCLAVKAQSSETPIENFLSEAPEPPENPAVKAAIQELKDLDALTDDEQMTSLGRVLASLPVHPSLGKQILLGILFRCLEPMLIVASASDDRPLISDPSRPARTLLSFKRQFAAGSRSDQVALINAYQEVNAMVDSSGPGQLLQACQEKHIRSYSFRGMHSDIQHLYETLASAGLVPYPPQRGNVLRTMPPDLNSNASSIPLIKALTFSGSSLNLGVGRKFSYRGKNEEALTIAFGGVNPDIAAGAKGSSEQKQGKTNLITFASKIKDVRIPNPKIAQTTIITPLMAILFGGRAKLKGNIVTLDDWLQLRITVDAPAKVGSNPNKNAARIIMELRKAVNRFLTIAFADLKDVSAMVRSDDLGTRQISQFNAIFRQKHPIREALATGLVKLLEAEEKTLQLELAEDSLPQMIHGTDSNSSGGAGAGPDQEAEISTGQETEYATGQDGQAGSSQEPGSGHSYEPASPLNHEAAGDVNQDLEASSNQAATASS